MTDLRRQMIHAALEAGAVERKAPTPHACQAALDALTDAEAEIERLRAENRRLNLEILALIDKETGE